MTITILKEITTEFEGVTTRTATIAIDDTYEWTVGGLPLEGDLLPVLEAKEAEYLEAAQRRQRLLPQDQKDQLGAKGWFRDNPNALLLFSLAVPDLAAEISDLMDASFPLLLPGQRKKWKWLVTGVVLAVRIAMRRLGFLD